MQRVTLVCRPYCIMSLESLGSLAHTFTDQYLRENFRRIVTGRKDVMSVIEGEPAAQMPQGSTPLLLLSALTPCTLLRTRLPPHWGALKLDLNSMHVLLAGFRGTDISIPLQPSPDALPSVFAGTADIVRPERWNSRHAHMSVHHMQGSAAQTCACPSRAA